ncbi:MAG: ADOP family duplicated permease [Gemmatimonadota bacterium]|nr:ADOP family duplicated permease [Gemmatimonadota bacterium]
MTPHVPPGPWERLLEVLLPVWDRRELLLDLRERFAGRAEVDPGRARMWYRWQVVRAIGPALALRARSRRGHRRGAGAGSGPWLRGLTRDIRLGARGLLARPSFAVVSILTLAVGIGASTALFSVVDPLLLKPLPYPDSDRLFVLWNRSPATDVAKDWHAPAHYRAFRDRLGSLEHLTLYGGGRVTARGEDGPPQFWEMVQTTSGLMRLLGTRAARGRVLQPEDDAAGAGLVAVLSHDIWVDEFGRDENIVGRTIAVGSATARVIGVIDPGSRIIPEALATVGAVSGVDVLLNLELDPDFLSNTGSWNWNVVGRLRGDRTRAQLDAELEGLMTSGFIDEFDIDDDRFAVYAVRVFDEIVGPLRPMALALLAGVGLVLLISCGNVAMLLLARGSARAGEVAVRRALGASRARVVRQLLAEGLVISAVAGALGVALARGLVRGLHMLDPTELPRLGEVALDLRAVTFAVAASLATTIVFALLPALRATAPDGVAGLRAGTRGGSTRGSGLRAVLSPGSVIAQAQIAFSLTLIVAASLLARSYAAVWRQDPGFDRESVVTVRMDLGPSGPERDDRWSHVSELLAALERIPGVSTAGVSNQIPLGASIAWGGAALAGVTEPVTAEFRAVTPGYFEAMGIEVLEGRSFEDADMLPGVEVAIVDQALVDRYWRGWNPIGLTAGLGTDSMTVVGVVRTIRQYRLDEESPRVFIYYPYVEAPTRSFYVAARTTLPPQDVVSAVRSTIRDVSASAVLEDIRPIGSLVSDALATRRAGAVLMVAFGSIATFLAVMGTYGLVSFRVASARRELGLRMALGAAPGRLVRAVARFAVSLVVVGAVMGVPLALGGARLLAGQLFEVGSADPASFALAALLTGGVAVLAAVIPARRAARVDPARVFRSE